MIQSECISNDDLCLFVKEINDFIKEINDLKEEIVDMQFSTASENDYVVYSVLIVYTTSK
ncbi:MAG: hypothetical protein ACFFG0_04270 [Candidatus Thorarchaeota archaeon]